MVLGADQVGRIQGGAYLEKPTDAADHVRMLLSMQGRPHRFFPAAVLVKAGTRIDVAQEEVDVHFRAFDDAVARAYVATGEGGGSCGGYESENRGAQLIARIDGSTHAGLGLPLLGVLAMLRRADVGGVWP